MKNKLLKYKKITLTLGILFIVLGLSFTVVETFYRPTSLNKLITNKLYSDPVNNSFNDQNFYNCVIDAYNSKNSTSYSYTYNLSDDELETITTLSCSGQSKTDDEKISDASGLEKLTSLTSLNVSYNKLTEINVSNNTLLQILVINNNNFENKIYIYKLENINTNNYSTHVTLPSSKNITLSNITTNENIDILSNEFNVKNAGNYDVIVNYTHDVSTSDNTFNVTYNVISVELLSNKYYIDNENDKIYIPHNETFDLNNVNISAGDYALTEEDNITKEYSNNKVIIKHGEDILKEFTIENVNLTSTTYNIDNSKDYIYIGLPEIELASFTSNIGTYTYDDDNKKLEIKINDLVIDSYDLIMMNSNKYNIYKDYIFIANNTFDINNIIASNASLNLNNNNEIEVIKDNNIIHTFDILSIDFGTLEVFNNNIKYEESSYENFINKITSSSVTYKLFKDNDEITSGNIENNMILKIYKDETLLASYIIVEEYITGINNIEIDETNKYIIGINNNTSVSNISNYINTTGNITVFDKDNNLKSNDNLLATGDKVKIELNSKTVTYTLVVKGDVDGDGEVTTADAYDIILSVLGKKTLNDVYEKAGIIDEGEEEPTTGDAYSVILYILGKKDNL